MTEATEAAPPVTSDVSTFAELTAEIVAAYVAKNSVPSAELPGLIQTVYQTIKTIGSGQSAAPAEPAKREPAVSIRKSITDEYLISLEDGRKLKSLKRYLSGLGMTFAEYKSKWGLPADYPAVAPAYTRKRSELAKTLGLGRKAAASAAAAEDVPEPALEQAEPELPLPTAAPKRGRAKKAA